MSSFLTSLDTGRLQWDELRRFPVEDPEERAATDGHVAGLTALLAERVDADAVDVTRTLPGGLLDALQDAGYLRLQLDREDGGLELSAYSTFRLVGAAAEHSAPVGVVVALANAAGAAALLPILPDGPLRDFVAKRVTAGTISGWADTEPTGQNNRLPATTATPTPDGTGYLLRGQKVFTGNATRADLMLVTAQVPGGTPGETCVCFVDTAEPGVRVTADHEFMGVAGLPNGATTFDDVFLPRERVLTADGGADIRLSPLVMSVGLVGRLYIAAAPALAIARSCLAWQRDFVERRTIDGRGLGEYDAVQRILATTLADVYAMDAVARWCLLGCGLADRWYERILAKNILTNTAWRVADRTMSLLGGEGFETAASKSRRGVPPLPVERAFRDARGLRIAGNVDFLLDYQAGRVLLARHYADPALRTAVPVVEGGDDAGGSPAHRQHLAAVAEQVRRFAVASRGLTTRHEGPLGLFADQQPLTLLGRVAGELLAATAVLGRSGADGDADAGEPDAARLADVWCTGARHRLAGHWRELEAAGEPDYAGVSRGWLARGRTADLAAV